MPPTILRTRLNASPKLIRWTKVCPIGNPRVCSLPQSRPGWSIAAMALRFRILGSGSSGNAALLESDDTRVLVDAGFSARKLGEMLATAGSGWDRIDAIFLTHEHSDHAAALSGLAK